VTTRMHDRQMSARCATVRDFPLLYIGGSSGVGKSTRSLDTRSLVSLDLS
jgi:hypothetical protein